MTILIQSTHDDLHADAVRWGLERLGASYAFWPAGDFPAEQGISATVDEAGEHCVLDACGGVHDLSSFGVVWNRRAGIPRVAASIDPRDRAYAMTQAREHLAAVKAVAAPRALWVNRPDAARDDLNKLIQLRLARRVGLSVPPTLCSNVPERIRAFFADQNGRVIFKSYTLGGWTEGGHGGSVLIGYTSDVTSASLADDAALRLAPGIFQRRIDRAFEVRVTVMGRSIFAARIDPPEDSGAVDWRITVREDLRVSAFALPADVADRLLDYMRGADLSFATFDLIVSPDGCFHFLEVNQMGQFLWKEEKDGSLPMLDAMCRFLVEGKRTFRYRRGPQPLSLADYLATERACALIARGRLHEA